MFPGLHVCWAEQQHGLLQSPIGRFKHKNNPPYLSYQETRLDNMSISWNTGTAVWLTGHRRKEDGESILSSACAYTMLSIMRIIYMAIHGTQGWQGWPVLLLLTMATVAVRYVLPPWPSLSFPQTMTRSPFLRVGTPVLAGRSLLRFLLPVVVLASCAFGGRGLRSISTRPRVPPAGGSPCWVP